MSTPVLPARDRAGRVYKPAIGSRLRPLLWVILIGFALLAANGFYLSSVTALTWYLGTTQQTFFYMIMVALHLFLGLVLVIPFLIFGFAHLATSWKRPNKRAIRYGLVLLARRAGHPGFGVHPGSDRRLRGPRHADPQSRLLVPRGRAAGGGCALRQAPAGGPADPLGMGAAAGDSGGRLRRDHGALALAGPQVIRRQGTEGGQAVLLPVRGHHRQRQVHSGQDADDGPVLPGVPQGRLQRLVSLGAPPQLVQQQGLPDERAGDAQGLTGARRLDPGFPLVRGLP